MGFFDKLHKLRDTTQGAIGAVVPRPGADIGGLPARGTVVELIQGPFGQRKQAVRSGTRSRSASAWRTHLRTAHPRSSSAT